MQNTHSYIRTYIAYVKMTEESTKFYEFLLKYIQKTHTKTFTPGKNMVYLYQTADENIFVQKLYTAE